MLVSVLFCQTDKESAYQLKNDAIELMDNGSPDEAISLLEKAKKLDPDSYIYDYEMAYAYSIKKDYIKGIESVKKTLKYKDANDACYQMLGNLYDYNGDHVNAIKTYDKGLKKFPDSGRLFLEKGVVTGIQGNLDGALSLFEAGIKAEPTYSSNYYRATQLFCSSDEKVWGMIYGEIFLNLEPGSERSSEISKLLYDTYKSQIKFTSDTSITVSFCKNATINISISDLKHLEEFKLPFGPLIYEPTLLLSIVGHDSISLSSLDKIRANFVDNYYEKKHNEKYPNVLFDFQRELKALGFFQVYNYWLLSAGEPGIFSAWQEENNDIWARFVDWFNHNGLALDTNNKFTRDQY